MREVVYTSLRPAEHARPYHSEIPSGRQTSWRVDLAGVVEAEPEHARLKFRFALGAGLDRGADRHRVGLPVHDHAEQISAGNLLVIRMSLRFGFERRLRPARGRVAGKIRTTRGATAHRPAVALGVESHGVEVSLPAR